MNLCVTTRVRFDIPREQIIVGFALTPEDFVEIVILGDCRTCAAQCFSYGISRKFCAYCFKYGREITHIGIPVKWALKKVLKPAVVYYSLRGMHKYTHLVIPRRLMRIEALHRHARDGLCYKVNSVH